MDINNKYTGFEKLLHDKMNNFEYPYDNKEWIKFKKELPKSPKSFTSPKNLSRFFIAAATVVIPILAIIYFINNSKKQDNNKTTVVNHATINERQTNTTTTDNNISSDKNENNANCSKSTVNSITSNNPSKESSYNNKENLNQKNSTNKNTAKKEDNTPINQNENKNIQNPVELIYADVIEGCAPLNVQFKPLISSDTISYLWAFGDYKTSTKQAPSHTYNKSGTYTVSLTVKFARSQQTKKITYSKNINVYSKPKANFNYTASDDGYDYTFTDVSADALYCLWNFGDKSASKDKSPVHTYKNNGPSNVQLIVFNASGCSDTITKTITVKLKEPFYLNNAFIPDGGITPLFGPSGENMNPDGYKMSIYDNNGKLVFETSDLEIKWDGKISGTNTDAKSGLYYRKVLMKDKYGILREWPGTVTLIWKN